MVDTCAFYQFLSGINRMLLDHERICPQLYPRPGTEGHRATLFLVVNLLCVFQNLILEGIFLGAIALERLQVEVGARRVRIIAVQPKPLYLLDNEISLSGTNQV